MEKLEDLVQRTMQRGLVRHPACCPSSTTAELDQVVVYSRLGDFHFQLPLSAAAKLSALPEEEPEHQPRFEVEWDTLDNYHLVLEVVEWAMDLRILCRLLDLDASSCGEEPWIKDSLGSFSENRLKAVDAEKVVQRIRDYLKVQPGNGELMRLHAIEAELNPLDRLFEIPLEKGMERLRV